MKWIAGSVLMAATGFFLGSRADQVSESTEAGGMKTRLLNSETQPASSIAEMTAKDLVAAAEGRRIVTERDRTRLRFAEWAETDPEAAMRSVMTFVPFEWRLELGQIVLETVMERNPEKALDLVLDPEFYDHMYINSWLAGVIPGWLKSDFDQAAPAILQRRDRFEAIIGEHSREELILFDSPLDSGDGKVVAFKAQMTSSDALHSWEGEADPAWNLQSVDAILEIPDSKARDIGLVFAITHTDPERAEAWIDLLSTDEARESGIEGYLANLAKRRPEMALAAMEKYGRKGRVSAFQDGWKKEGLPGEAEAQKLPDAVKDELAFFIADKSDLPPDEKLNRLLQLPGAKQQDTLVRTTITSWIKSEPEQASVWIRDSPDSADKESLVVGLVQSIVKEDPESAFRWAQTLTDPGLRERLVRVSFRHWMATNPAMAEEAIRAANTGEATKTSLLKNLNTGQR